ncbi:hypothetical protein SUGI_0373910 [Cryptomeria japonica]|nr:hypothetical protein SUGI_0373910 [Cryptomeria japonica]
MRLPPKEINLISCGSLNHVSDIKLIRTDTTLDLSQKAEKVNNFFEYDGDIVSLWDAEFVIGKFVYM